jgi:hypothetical protein
LGDAARVWYLSGISGTAVSPTGATNGVNVPLLSKQPWVPVPDAAAA